MGEALYNRYTSILLNLQRCMCDSWDELSMDDQAVWEALVAEVGYNPIEG